MSNSRFNIAFEDYAIPRVKSRSNRSMHMTDSVNQSINEVENRLVLAKAFESDYHTEVTRE